MNCPDKYVTQRMCDEAVADSLAALRLIQSRFKSRLFGLHVFFAFFRK